MPQVQEEGKQKFPHLQLNHLILDLDPPQASAISPVIASFNESKPAKMKPPCKKKFQENFEDIRSKIKALEAELKSLHLSSAISKDEEMKSLKLQRSMILTRRKEIAEELENCNKQSNTKKTNLMRLQHNFQYKSEDLINNAISKLAYQLKKNNYRASEERKIVQEIDSLNRSKKSLSEYNVLQGEVNEVRLRQASLRKEKDNMFSQLQSIKAQEDSIKAQDMMKQEKMEEIKLKLNDLHQQRRELIAHHQHEILVFEQLKEQKHKEAVRKKEEEQRAAHSAKKKEIEENICVMKPYQEELLLCETLISYLQRYDATPSSTPSSSVETPTATPTSPVVKELDTGEMVYVLKRREGAEICIQNSRKGKKGRNKDKKRTLQNKVLNHTPKVFEQFCRLGLQAPSCSKEIPVSVEQLKAKKKYYSQLNSNPEAACDKHILCSLTSSCPTETVLECDNAVSEKSNAIPELQEDEQQTKSNAVRTTESQNSDVSCAQIESYKDENSKEKIPADSSMIVDDGYSEVSVLDQPKDNDDLKAKPNITKQDSPHIITVTPSDTCCSNSSADSALAEEVKSLESPEVIYSIENRFANWQND